MKYIINDKLNTDVYKKETQGFFTKNILSSLSNDKNMSKYDKLSGLCDGGQFNTSVVVDNVKLEIDHTNVMNIGLEYLFSRNVIVSIEDYLEEYNNWYSSMRMKVNSKSDLTKSSETLSTQSMTDRFGRKVLESGNDQYCRGWCQYLVKMIEPDKVKTKVSDETGKYSKMLQKNRELISEVTGSQS